MKFLSAFLLAFIFLASPVVAQTCNNPSGFVKLKGPIPIGDTVQVDADCQSLIDAGQALVPSQNIIWSGQQAFIGGIAFSLAGTPANGSPIVTGFSSTSSIATGDVMVGNCIPLGTTVISIDSPTQIHMSANASCGGATPILFGPINPLVEYFVGAGQTGFMQRDFAAIGRSATNLEVMNQNYFNNKLGFANRAAAYKIVSSDTMDCQSDVSSNCYIRNDILNATHSSIPATWFATGYEIDFNQNTGLLTWGTNGAFGTQNAGYGIVSVASGGFPITANYWATSQSSGSAFAGFAITGPGAITTNGAGFFDNSNSPNILLGLAAFSHTNGVNFFAATFTGNAFVAPNANGLAVSNAAGNATIDAIKVDASNVVNVSNGSQDIRLNGNHVRIGGAQVSTITNCGAGATLAAASTDTMGAVTIGTTPGACAITFANAYTAAPGGGQCIVYDSAGFIGNTASTTTLTLTAPAAGQKVTWFCPAFTGG